MAMIEVSRPSCAKVCVQIDLLKKLPSRLWLECVDSIPGCWQSIEYDKLPKYCKQCIKLGRDFHSCKFAHPVTNHNPAPSKIYKKKDSSDPTTSMDSLPKDLPSEKGPSPSEKNINNFESTTFAAKPSSASQ